MLSTDNDCLVPFLLVLIIGLGMVTCREYFLLVLFLFLVLFLVAFGGPGTFPECSPSVP